MTTIKSASDQGSIANIDDLPPPDSLISANPVASPRLQQAFPTVMDSGRISFGAACRPALKK